MKIQTTQNQMIIDNSATAIVVIGGFFCVIGIGAAGVGLLLHIPMVIGVGAIFAVLGALFVIFAKSTHIVLDKSGASSLSSKTMFSQSKTQAFSLADVNTVLLEASQSTDRVEENGSTRDQTNITSNLFLATTKGDRIPIGTAKKAMNIGGVIGSLIVSLPLKKEAEQIAAFIGVPLQANDTVGFGRPAR